MDRGAGGGRGARFRLPAPTFFDLRAQWTPPTKRRPERIVELDPGLHGLLNAIHADGASFKDQLELARRMLPLIYDETST